MRLYRDLHEMPLHNWEELNRTGDLNFLLLEEKSDGSFNWFNMFKKKHGVKLFTKETLRNCYLDLQQDYMLMTGSIYELVEWAEITIEKMRAVLKYAEGDLSQINMINHFELLLKTYSDQGENPIKNRMRIMKMYGNVIPPKDITVAAYIQLIELVKEINAANTNPNEENN